MQQSKLSCAKVINLKSTGGKTPESSDISSAPSAISNLVTEQVPSHDPYQAFRFRDYRLLFAGTLIATIGEQMLNVAIGWELYERTGSALALGGVGLVQVLPIIILSLPAGHLADRFNRRLIVIVARISLALATLGLAALSYTHGSLALIYGCLLLTGIVTAFSGPANSTLIPQTVPERAYTNTTTWSSSSWQPASVLHPALGGFVIAFLHSPTLVYALVPPSALFFAFLIF